MFDNDPKNAEDYFQSDDVSSHQKAKVNEKLNFRTQKVPDINLETKMIDVKLGQEYEKMVNKAFKDKLLRGYQGYFKTNLKLQSIHDSNSMFANWKLIKKTEKSRMTM